MKNRVSVLIITILFFSCCCSSNSNSFRRDNKAIAVDLNVEDDESKIGDQILSASYNEQEKNKISFDNIGALKEGEYDIESAPKMLYKGYPSDGKRIAFLTFDDGPSTTVTPLVLNILKENNVKATFFLVGKRIEAFKEAENLVKRIYDEGHSIGNHTYSHDLKALYPKNRIDIVKYMEEIDKTNNVFKRIIGEDFSTRVSRMPGGDVSRVYYGDKNLEPLKDKLRGNNMFSVDWNALNEDAEGKGLKSDGLFERLKINVAGKGKVIILMHDGYGKEETAKSLDRVIKYLKEEGYEFGILR